MNIGDWPDLEQRTQIFHAPPRSIAIAVNRDAAAYADAEVDSFTVEQASADTFTVGTKEITAIHDPGNRKYIVANFLRATIVGQAQNGRAATYFPKRQQPCACATEDKRRSAAPEHRAKRSVARFAGTIPIRPSRKSSVAGSHFCG